LKTYKKKVQVRKQHLDTTREKVDIMPNNEGSTKVIYRKLSLNDEAS